MLLEKSPNRVLVVLDDMTEWDSFVESSSHGTIYHTSSWMDVITKTFPHIKGQVIGVRKKDGTLLGGIPVYKVKSFVFGNHIVSVPFALFGGPISKDISTEAYLMKKMTELFQEEKDFDKYLEIRCQPHQLFQGDFAITDNFVTHVLKLEMTDEHLMKSFSKNVFYGLKKSFKRNLSFVISENRDDIQIFHKHLSISRKNLGLPQLPLKFFLNLWDAFYEKGYLRLFFVEKDGNIVGTHLVLLFNGVAYSEYKCSLREFRKDCVDYYLEWNSIVFAQKSNCNYYNFGRTSKDNQGLLFYKSRWNTVQSDIPIHYFPKERAKNRNGGGNEKNSLVRKVLNKSPEFLYKILSKLIYTQMG